MTKAGRKKGESLGRTNREIVREIAEVTQLKPAIVDSVLKCWTDIFIRDVVMTGKFHWGRAFTVRTKKIPEYKAYNVITDEYEMRPESTRLQMTISPKIRDFWKWKETNERNKARGVTQDNWRSYYDDNKE